MNSTSALAFANVVLQTAFAIGIPTLLMGMSLPLAIKSAASVSQVGRDVGIVLRAQHPWRDPRSNRNELHSDPLDWTHTHLRIVRLDRCHYRGNRPDVAPSRTALCHSSDRCHLRS